MLVIDTYVLASLFWQGLNKKNIIKVAIFTNQGSINFLMLWTTGINPEANSFLNLCKTL